MKGFRVTGSFDDVRQGKQPYSVEIAAEDEAAAYAADDNQEDFQGTDMELYLIMEERIKKAMLDNPEKDTIIVPLGDLKAKHKEKEGQDGNRINSLYSYSPYFPDILMVGLELYSDSFSGYYTYAEVSHTKGATISRYV